MIVFGKHFESMYTGSMVGSGALTFAVWGYVISHMVPVGRLGEQEQQVELNPRLLGPILGEDVEEVRKVIERFCQPDPESRTKAEEGRRLIRLGQFDYRVVNGPKYRAIRDEAQRREQNREAQRRYREKAPRLFNRHHFV